MWDHLCTNTASTSDVTLEKILAAMKQLEELQGRRRKSLFERFDDPLLEPAFQLPLPELPKFERFAIPKFSVSALSMFGDIRAAILAGPLLSETPPASNVTKDGQEMNLSD